MSSTRRRHPPEHRVWRARMPREGMLLQVDGTHHAWLEERGPRFTLLLAVDDATGDVPYALFRPAEDARGYFSLMKQIVQRRGLPLALYSDQQCSSSGHRDKRQIRRLHLLCSEEETGQWLFPAGCQCAVAATALPAAPTKLAAAEA